MVELSRVSRVEKVVWAALGLRLCLDSSDEKAPWGALGLRLCLLMRASSLSAAIRGIEFDEN